MGRALLLPLLSLLVALGCRDERGYSSAAAARHAAGGKSGRAQGAKSNDAEGEDEAGRGSGGDDGGASGRGDGGRHAVSHGVEASSDSGGRAREGTAAGAANAPSGGASGSVKGANAPSDGSQGSDGDGGTAPASAFSVVTCAEPAAGSGCSVAGDGPHVVLRGDVLTPGVVYTNGTVRIEDGVIRCVGCDCDDGAATVVSCADAVIAPGFVNPHDHVAYDAEGPRPPGTERYDHRHDWRLGLRGHDAISYEGGATERERATQELRMLLGGVTTLAGGAGVHGFVRNADMPELGEGLPTAPADSETFPLDDAGGLLLATGCAYGKDRATEDDVERAGAFLAHLGEGVDANAENELVCAMMPDFGLVQPSSGVVHAVATNATLAAGLAARSARVVWSPRSNVALYGNTAPVPLLLRSGVEVALGTDWLLTGSMNLLRELACAKTWSDVYFDHALDDHALFVMATTAGARAVGAGDAIGRLAPGMLADVNIVDRRGREPYAALINAEPADFLLVSRGGQPLYGRAELLAGLGTSGCDELDVCGAAQRVCTADSGFSLAELASTADATYPLFACDTPPNEPTCVPARPGEYDGVPNELDHDGDGVADGDDRCPSVFDPPRPLDAGAQADADGDGRGDACDPCPLDANDACALDHPNDRDGDGVADGRDSCPDARDPEQADDDGDGRGNACDFCATPNPGALPCALPIAAIRAHAAPEHPPRHALVEVASAVVTAVRPNSGSSRGFYIEDDVVPYSGIFVYTGSDAPGVAVGDRISLRGRYEVYYDMDELVDATLLARDALVESPTPVTVRAEDAGDDGALAAAYDSMLVTVTDAIVVETNPDAPSDYDETELSGALRLDDLLDPELDNAFAPNTGFSAVTGILGYSFDHRKLMPRSAADLAP